MNRITLPFPEGGCPGESLRRISNRFPSLLAGIRKAGLCWWLALGFTVAGAFQARGQNVTLGEATFSAASDQVAPDWYWPLPSAVDYTYEGYGQFAGATRTETYSRGEWIAGVKTVRWHLETKYPGSVTPQVEDWWLAFDTAGDLCVLQIVQGGRTAYGASAQDTPPVWLPGKPVAGQKWDLLGNTLTVEDIIASLHAGGVLKLAVAVPGRPVEYKTFNGGIGVVQDALSENPRPGGSGWRLSLQ
jgi:hypothetical protein